MGTAPFETAGLKVEPSLEIHPLGFAKAAGIPGLDRFLAAQGDQWEVRLDRRNDRPALIQGSGVALLPGRGNQLTNAQAGLRAQADPRRRRARGARLPREISRGARPRRATTCGSTASTASATAATTGTSSCSSSTTDCR